MKFLKLFVVGFLLSGCATIISGTTDKVSVESSPSGAHFTVQNNDGVVVASGVTPSKVTLKRGDGYFTDATYRVNYSLTGFYPQTGTITGSLNPWYFGNLLFGGIIVGGVIVDPLSGAMWSLPSDTSSVLFQAQ